jgi:hypothetical protein
MSSYLTTGAAASTYYLQTNPSGFITSSALSGYATLASPTFTGNPTAPTPTSGDNDTSIATTAFVQSAIIAGSAHAETLQAEVRNNTGATLAPFTVVYINGALGNRATVAKSQANAESTSAGTYAITEASIANNADGNVIAAGVLSNIDTSAFTDGDKLYLSPTVAGGVTTTKPSAPNHLVYVGVVTRSHPTLGTVSVRIQNGYELGEIHDVALASEANNDLLVYETSTALWKNKSFSTLGLLTSATAATTYAPIAGPTFTGTVTIPAGASISGYLTSATAASTYQTLSGMSSYLTTATASTTYAPLASPSLTGVPLSTTAAVSTNTTQIATTAFVIGQAGSATPLMDNGTAVTGTSLLYARQDHVHPSDTAKASLTGATFTGLVTTPAATTTTAGLNLPHGAAPTAPVNGDIWTTTGGVFARINAGTTQLMNLGSTQTVSGSITFSNASQTLGNSTAASTINIGTGATLTATTKAVNIGTNGVAGSTTNIAIGSTTGTSTTTLQGTTNGITAAADTNSVALATTAYVVGQAGTATPVVDGTAAVGTSLRYARQDHVHPTDTSRAPLASPTFTGTVTIPAGASISGFAPLASPSLTGTPLSTTAAADTNTTQIATTAFVVGQASSSAPVIDGTATIGTSLKYARADHVHPTDTSRAPLASPSLTGTPLSTTAAVDTNTTQIATTAYVVAQAGSATPIVNGTAAVGTSLRYARQDHVHGTDTTRAALASPTFTGTPLSTTASAGDYSTQIATTEYALKATLDPCMHKVVNDDWAASTSGTGATTQQNGDLKTAIGPTGIGYARMSQGLQLTSVGVGQDDSIDWSKKIYFSGRVMMLRGSASNLIYRVNLGDNFNSGDPANRCVALKCTPNATALQLQVHNGTTLTTVNSSFTPTIGATFDFLIVSNAGTVTLFVNRSQVATTTSGPTNRAGGYYYNAMTICCENTTGTNGYAELSLVNQSAYFTP